MNKMVGAHHLKEKKKVVHGDIPTKVRKTPLVGFSAKNRFYRANRDLGRIFKTEFILQYSDVFTDVKLRSNYNPRSLVFTIGFSAGVVGLARAKGPKPT